MAFVDTDNKRVIRRVWDRAILSRRREPMDRNLYYFGLTGPEMHDILDWIDLLHRDVTAVEEQSKHFFDNLSSMMDIAAVHDINLEVLRAKVERIFESGRSLDNERPRRGVIQDNRLSSLSYDLVNLDFDGGLGNVLVRHRSIEALLRAQAETPFTLFITYNVRSHLQEQIADELANLKQQIEPDGEGIVAWYERDQCPEAARLKAIVPVVISTAAATALMDCRPYPPIRYVGYRTTLVHFAFDLTPRPNVLRAHHPSMRTLATLPLLDSIDGKLRVSALQDPGFSRDRCCSELDFLPDSEKAAIIATMT
jgi:hypothetical protein